MLAVAIAVMDSGMKALRHETWIATSQPCGSVSLPVHGAVQQPQSVVDEVEVRVQRRAGLVAVEVCDDGVGRADPAGGSGRRGLADRVEALGGRLRIDSPGGRRNAPPARATAQLSRRYGLMRNHVGPTPPRDGSRLKMSTSRYRLQRKVKG